jgi:hypothetical protein
MTATATLRRSLSVFAMLLTIAVLSTPPARAQLNVPSVDDALDQVGGNASGDITDTPGEIGDAVNDTVDDVTGDAGDAVEDAGDTVGGTVGGDAGETVTDTTDGTSDTITGGGDKAGDTAGGVVGSIEEGVDGVTGGNEGPGDTESPEGSTGGDTGPKGTSGSPTVVESSGPASIEDGTGADDSGSAGTSPGVTSELSNTADTGAVTGVAGALVDSARRFAFPLLLSLAVAVFLALQNRWDHKDPKLARALVDRSDDFLSFS